MGIFLIKILPLKFSPHSRKTKKVSCNDLLFCVLIQGFLLYITISIFSPIF